MATAMPDLRLTFPVPVLIVLQWVLTHCT